MGRKAAVKRIFSYTRSFKGYFLLSVILSAVYVVSLLFIPILVGRAIDCMTGQGNVDFLKVGTYVSTIGILTAVIAISRYFIDLTDNALSFSFMKKLRNDAMKKIHRLPALYLDRTPYGEIVSRIVSDTQQAGDGVVLALNQGISGVFTLVGTVIFMFIVNWKMTVIVLLSTPLALLISWFISKYSYGMFKKSNNCRGEVTSFAEESLSGEDIIQAFGAQEKKESEFGKVNNEFCKYDKKALFYSSLPNPGTRFVYALIYAGLVFGGAFLVIDGQISVGLLASFLSYATQFTKPFNEITDVAARVQNAVACAGRVFDFLDEPEEVPDSPTEEKQVTDYIVELENVSFSYDKKNPVINNFSLKVKSGEKIAIVGPTGCGKTTLINLLMRFYDIDSGRITVGGKEIRDYSRRELRSRFGMVLQDTWIKSATIRENIAFGRKDAIDEEIHEAARLALADGFIKRMPEGYDTVLSEGDDKLSQGQKQLISIARVFLARPEILILDEATSSIDTRTEVKVQEAFDRLMRGRTSFVVAHRLSTIENADRIIVMDKGRIVEQGTHRELLEKVGFYHRLYNSM